MYFFLRKTAVSKTFLRKQTDYQFWKNKSAWCSHHEIFWTATFCTKQYLFPIWTFPGSILQCFLSWSYNNHDLQEYCVNILDGIFWQKNYIVTLYYVLEHLWHLICCVFFCSKLTQIQVPKTQIGSKRNYLPFNYFNYNFGLS